MFAGFAAKFTFLVYLDWIFQFPFAHALWFRGWFQLFVCSNSILESGMFSDAECFQTKMASSWWKLIYGNIPTLNMFAAFTAIWYAHTPWHAISICRILHWGESPQVQTQSRFSAQMKTNLTILFSKIAGSKHILKNRVTLIWVPY